MIENSFEALAPSLSPGKNLYFELHDIGSVIRPSELRPAVTLTSGAQSVKAKALRKGLYNAAHKS